LPRFPGSRTIGTAACIPILQIILQVVEDPEVREASDRDLLQRFRERREAAAFHVLLRRHGPMVFEVCRGVLGNEANAADAFQATFLILARKAASIRKAASVGNWLHSVAYRTALQARAQEAARKKSEAQAPARHLSEPDDWTWREVRAALHEEPSRLPERYRAALVLCYLENKTQDQARAQLGLAKSTVKERLERGKELLRARLVRRGLGPAALLVAATWPAPVAAACYRTTFLSATVKAACLSAARQATPGVISARVAVLSEGVMRAMFVTKMMLVVGLLTLATAVGSCGVAFLSGGTVAQAQAAPPSAQAVAAPDNKDIERLIKQLGSDRFKEREAATQALKKVGKPALKALHKAATENADAEVRIRAEALILAIRESLIRPIDLGPHVNQKLKERFHNYREGNDLATLPTGRQIFAGMAFTVGGGVVQVGGEKPAQVVGIKVDAQALKLHFLHASGFCGNFPRNTPIGKYVVHYDDKTTEEIEIVYGRDVVDWWVQPGVADPTRSKVAWEGQNALSPIKLFLTTWENPHPDKRIVTLDYVATGGNPFCVAISAEN
jgi:RNA polymerase sigma factor (sigma-70 family)